MANITYTCGQMAVARRLGDGDEEYKIRICGIVHSFPECTFYIVELIDKIPGQGKWTHIVLPSGCIDDK